MRCIAIDDEPLALKQIVAYIAKTPFLELVCACSNAFEAKELLASQSVDLMFVDINMPGMSGMELVKSLTRKPLVIFTTAYSEFAVESYKVNAQNYLLKPFSLAEFTVATQKALHYWEQLRATETGSSLDDSIWVKSEYHLVRVSLPEVLFIEGMNDYVRIHLETGKPIMTLSSLKAMEEQLPSSKFMRIHRSWIINLEKIVQIEKGQAILTGKHAIPIGDQYREALLGIAK
jgi:two-component system LytT family response regulator